MSTAWEKYYAERPLQHGRRDYLAQVGHTFRGQAIPEEQYQATVAHIAGLLQIGPEDRLLDLCCGNGVITHELAATADQVVGVDFSAPLIDIARTDHQRENTSCLRGDVRRLDTVAELNSWSFTRVLMYGALQHFERAELLPLLATLRRLCTDDAVIVLGFVPNRARRHRYLNTPRRWLTHWWLRFRRKELTGTWWSQAVVEDLCRRANLRCEFFFGQPEIVHSAQYRFDVRIT